ncbi:MAG: aldose 1-epimerase [Cyclobacteriaceae bacterium]
MFKEARYNIGQWEVISLKNETGAGFEIIPEKGGCIRNLWLGQKATGLLDPLESKEEISSNPWYKQALLFPFPNRLNDGKYAFEGRQFQFPINEPDRNNTLHGFISTEQLEIGEIQTSENKASIELKYAYEGKFEYYPFPVNLSFIFEVSEKDFTLTAQITNSGKTSLPYGFGWHPYFLFENTASMQVPKCELINVNEKNIPTGKTEAFDRYEFYKEVNEPFDTCFLLPKGTDPITQAGCGDLKLEVSGDESTPFLQIFNPAPEKLAIEPMTCGIDAFNNEQGLITLAPNESRIHRCSVRIINE